MNADRIARGAQMVTAFMISAGYSFEEGALISRAMALMTSRLLDTPEDLTKHEADWQSMLPRIERDLMAEGLKGAS